MKKVITIIAVLVFLVIIATVASIVLGIMNQKTAIFKLEGSGYTVRIYPQNSDQSIAELNSSKDISLDKGTYYYVVEGNNISETRQDFVVGEENSTVTVDPSYTGGYLAELALEELRPVRSLLESTYDTTIDDYDIGSFYLYKRGEWGAGYLVQRVDPRQDPDVYRYVVQKIGDVWKIIASPELTISSFTYPDIPKEVLTSINSSVGN